MVYSILIYQFIFFASEDLYIDFLIYINKLPLVLNKISSPVLFADDTSVIISELDPFILQDKLTNFFLNFKYIV
jgi:hypothetical protein